MGQKGSVQQPERILSVNSILGLFCACYSMLLAPFSARSPYKNEEEEQEEKDNDGEKPKDSGREMEPEITEGEREPEDSDGEEAQDCTSCCKCTTLKATQEKCHNQRVSDRPITLNFECSLCLRQGNQFLG